MNTPAGWSSLTGKMVGLVVLAALSFGALLWLVVGPRTAATVAAATEPLVHRSAEVMRAGAHASAQLQAETLTTLIEHSTESRHATLSDLPLELYDGDSARIHAAIEEQDRALGHRLVENVGRLAAEMEARALVRIDAEAETLRQQQRQLAATMANELRTASLVLLGGAVAVLLGLLALGLHRLVVRPVRALRWAAASVAQGRLEVEVSARGDDEVAHLVRSFRTMVADLATSRRELEDKRNALGELNANLEREVGKQTAALQEALDGLRATQRDLALADRMASLGTLAGGIAHEFNNLAGGIAGCAREMLAREGNGSPQREPLEVIVRAAERAIDVTAKLLRFARPHQPGSATVEVASLLREAMALVQSQAREQRVETHPDLAADLRVRGDASALHQVVVNLFSNALQAMPHGGALYVEATRAQKDIVVRVRDTGTGIARGDLDRVFDPFFSTKTAEAATPGRGAGLGLAVSYGIVQAHGGQLQVESTPGAGSTFTIRLPAVTDGAVVPRDGAAP